MNKEKRRTALFAGTFDPFTIGHHRIVQRALNIFDLVIVAIGHNAGKNTMYSLDERTKAIRELYANEPHIKVTSYTGLTTDYAINIGADCLLRGIRSVKDLEYERDIADINRQISGIETLFILSEPQYSAVSSSVIRELISYGKDVSDFLPQRPEQSTSQPCDKPTAEQKH